LKEGRGLSAVISFWSLKPSGCLNNKKTHLRAERIKSWTIMKCRMNRPMWLRSVSRVRLRVLRNRGGVVGQGLAIIFENKVTTQEMSDWAIRRCVWVDDCNHEGSLAQFSRNRRAEGERWWASSSSCSCETQSVLSFVVCSAGTNIPLFGIPSFGGFLSSFGGFLPSSGPLPCGVGDPEGG